MDRARGSCLEGADGARGPPGALPGGKLVRGEGVLVSHLELCLRPAEPSTFLGTREARGATPHPLFPRFSPDSGAEQALGNEPGQGKSTASFSWNLLVPVPCVIPPPVQGLLRIAFFKTEFSLNR